MVEALQAAGAFRVRGLTRNPDSLPARALHARGVEVVRADFDDPTTLAPALQGACPRARRRGPMQLQAGWGGARSLARPCAPAPSGLLVPPRAHACARARGAWAPTPQPRPLPAAGCRAAFLMTNHFDHLSAQQEIQQAQALFGACQAAGVGHVVWSSLDDTRPATQGSMHLVDGQHAVRGGPPP